MRQADIASRLVLIEETQRLLLEGQSRVELALARVESPSALSLVAQRLLAIDRKLALLVPPDDVRAAMDATTEHIADMADAAPLQSRQLAEMTDWLRDRMSGDQLQFQFDDLMFVTKQLISIWEGSRTDQVLLRGDVRRLAALVETALAGRADPPWRAGDAERRRASGF